MSKPEKPISNSSLNLMARRLGIHAPGLQVHDPKEMPMDSVDTTIEGVHHQSQLLNNMGGHAQQERMIYDKKRSLDRALKYSYQGADIKKVDAEDDERPCRALINPNKLKPDYDDKVVSCNWDYELTPGTVFKWMGTDTHWLIYLQDLTELAYFRGEIRRCKHTIKWFDKDTNEVRSVWAAIRGPVETKINSVTKNNLVVDLPNLTLSILIPSSEGALEYFRRYREFYLQDDAPGAPLICWRVNTIDWISMPGVIELVAQEDFSNPDVDDIGNIPDIKVITERIEKEESFKKKEESKPVKIIGENFIKPKITAVYTCSTPGEWRINGKNCPIEILSKNDTEIKLRWSKFYSGQFILEHVNKTGNVISKTIVVETLY
jgi:hypothetical protein